MFLPLAGAEVTSVHQWTQGWLFGIQGHTDFGGDSGGYFPSWHNEKGLQTWVADLLCTNRLVIAFCVAQARIQDFVQGSPGPKIKSTLRASDPEIRNTALGQVQIQNSQLIQGSSFSFRERTPGKA